MNNKTIKTKTKKQMRKLRFGGFEKNKGWWLKTT
jgi:hypothetical protein